MSKSILTLIINFIEIFRKYYLKGERTVKRRVITNLIFSIPVSLMYGMIFSLYVALFAFAFFDFKMNNIYTGMIFTTLFIIISHFALIMDLKEEEKFVLPEVYLSFLLLGIYRNNEKHILKNLMKITLVAMPLVIIVLKVLLLKNEDDILKLALILLFLSIIKAFYLLNNTNKENLYANFNDFASSLIPAITLCFICIVALSSYGTVGDISILIIVLMFIVAMLPELFFKTYNMFCEKYEKEIEEAKDKYYKKQID